MKQLSDYLGPVFMDHISRYPEKAYDIRLTKGIAAHTVVGGHTLGN